MRNVYFVASGAVELVTAGQPLRVGRGDMFGHVALLTRRHRRTEARAIAPSTLLVLDESRFRRLLENSESVRRGVMESAARRGIPQEQLQSIFAHPG